MRLFYRFVRAVARTGFRLNGGIEVIGAHNVPDTGPVIVTANHVSFLDPPAVGVAIRREGRFLARDTLWRVRWFGKLIGACGAIPINRDKPNRASFRAVLTALEEGFPVVMFPEGTRSADGRLQRGQPGIALIVQKAGAPVVPAAVLGTEHALPRGAKRPRRGKVRVAFGDPLFFTPDSPRAEIVGAIMRAIAALLTDNGVPSTAREDDAPSADQ